MASKRHTMEVPDDAKLDVVTIENDTRSYHIAAEFESTEHSYEFVLKVGKQSDLGRALTAIFKSMISHPKGKVS